MKTLLMTGDVDLRRVRGGSLHFRELALALHRLGWKVVCLVPWAGVHRFHPEIPVWRVPGFRMRGLGTLAHRLCLPWVLLAAAVRFRSLRVYERELTHSGWLYLPLRRCWDWVVEVNGILERELPMGRFRRCWTRIDQRQTYRHARGVVAVSRSIRRWLMEARGVPSGKAVVVENGVNLETFEPKDRAESRRRVGVSLDGPLIGFVGTLASYQGLEVLMEAFESIRTDFPGARLWLVGDGPSAAFLRAEAARRGWERDIRFTGWVPHEELVWYYNAFDVCVAPFTGVDRSPLKVAEAMACGRPVVVSRYDSELAELLERESAGWLVSPGDREGLVRSLGEALGRPDEARQRGRRARQAALGHLGWDRCAVRVERLYLEMDV
jgi:glycosyltransferase involved in cell wall biosynthesis